MAPQDGYTPAPGDKIGELVKARLDRERTECDPETAQDLGDRALQTSLELRIAHERRIEEQRENHENYFKSKLE